MNLKIARSTRPSSPPAPALVLIVGSTATAHEAARSLEPDGVTTIETAIGNSALARARESEPDLILVGRGDTQDMSGGEFVRRLATQSVKRPPLVIIGARHDDDTDSDGDGDSDGERRGSDTAGDKPAAQAEYLPAGVGVAELVDHIRRLLHRLPPRRTPGRPAISTQRMSEEIDRELHRAKLAGRPGMLVAVGVAELQQLRLRLGPQAEQAVATAFDEWVALDAPLLEQHCSWGDDGFLLLLPETDLASGLGRLRELSSRISGAVLDIAGEQVRVTPVMGYASFDGAGSASDLRDRAELALDDAVRHLDLVPVRFTTSLASTSEATPGTRDRVLSLVERIASPLQVVFTLMILLSLPFIIYVAVWFLGFDLTRVTYPLVAAAIVGTAAILWLESFQAVGAVQVPPESPASAPVATAIVAAYLPNEAATIIDTLLNLLGQDYPGELQVILAYNSPQRLPVEDALEELAAHDSRLLLLRVAASTSKAQNINAALAHVSGEFVGVFDADHHPAPGSFSRALRWLSNGYDVVQGHCVVRNGEASWVARLVAVEFETIYAVSHPGRARLHGFGIFGGSNGYWRSDALRQIRMQRSMLTEDIDSSMRGLQSGLRIVSDPGLLSTELAPTTMEALWNQRMRWAQGWAQTARRHLGSAIRSDRLGGRQKLGAVFLLGWTQMVPWITIQVIPMIAFFGWRNGGLSGFELVPLYVLLSLFTVSVGVAQATFAFVLGDLRIRQHRWWFVVYAIHSTLWFGELKNLISRVAQLKELLGEHQWRITPRSTSPQRETAAVLDLPQAPRLLRDRVN